MKNVKVKRGQKWSNENDKAREVTIADAIDGCVKYIQYPMVFSMHLNQFVEHFKFIPQNDLEWLAVNEPEWFHGDCNWIRRDKTNNTMYTDEPNNELNKQYTYYHWSQLQNMRHELGLDDKPNRSIYLGPIPLNYPCVLTPIIKEPKMIDLSIAKVGDEYQTEYNDVFKMVSCNGNSICWSGYSEGDGPFYYVTDYSGVFQDNDDTPNLFSKCESRLWPKDLPDADVGKDKVVFTQAMADAGVDLTIGMNYFDDDGQLCEFIGRNGPSIIGRYAELPCDDHYLCICDEDEIQPVDTRTDLEKISDEVKLVIGSHVCFASATASATANADILKGLLFSDKFTITLNKD